MEPAEPPSVPNASAAVYSDGDFPEILILARNEYGGCNVACATFGTNDAPQENSYDYAPPAGADDLNATVEYMLTFDGLAITVPAVDRWFGISELAYSNEQVCVALRSQGVRVVRHALPKTAARAGLNRYCMERICNTRPEIYLVEIDSCAASAVIEALAMVPGCIGVEENSMVVEQDVPPLPPPYNVDPGAHEQWNLWNDGQLGGLTDFDIGWIWDDPLSVPVVPSRSVTLAVVDKPVDYYSQEFRGRVVGDLYGRDPDDDMQHGNQVASVAAATGGNGYGVVGIAGGITIDARHRGDALNHTCPK